MIKVKETSDDLSVCALCSKAAQQRCSSCKKVAYCTRDHQKAHWKTHKLECIPFEVKRNEALGRHLVALRDILPRSLIISETCLVVGPKLSEPDPVCLGCYRPVDVTQDPKCLQCLWPVCHPNCPGLKHASHHLPECLVLRLNSQVALNGNLHYSAITPLRVLILQKRNSKKFEEIMSLESHIKDRGPTTNVYKEMDTNVVKYLTDNFLNRLDSGTLPDMSSTLLHIICGIIDVNALEVPTATGELIALYNSTCMMEHNCIPNTKHSFIMEDFKINVVATMNIKKGEHISTMYTNALWGTNARLAHLKDSKYFICTCKRCLDPTELSTHYSSLKCIGGENSEVSCRGFILPKDSIDPKSDWKCDTCPVILNSDHVSDLVARLSAQVDQAMLNPKVNQLEQLIKNLEALVHKNHFHCYSVKHSLIQLYGRQPGYSHKELSDDVLQRKIGLCQELLEVTSILDPGNSRLFLYSSVLMFELSSALVELSSRSKDSMETNKFLVDAKSLLDTCLLLLKDEPRASAGGDLYVVAKESLQPISGQLNACVITEVD